MIPLPKKASTDAATRPRPDQRDALEMGDRIARRRGSRCGIIARSSAAAAAAAAKETREHSSLKGRGVMECLDASCGGISEKLKRDSRLQPRFPN
jgi:hypothetical protein